MNTEKIPSKTPTNQNPAPQQSPDNESVEQLAGRLSEVEGISDDTAQFLAENWQRFVALVLIAVLAVWLIGQFRTAVETKAGEASTQFSEIQEKFSALDSDLNISAADSVEDSAADSEVGDSEGDAAGQVAQKLASNETAVVDTAFILEKNYSGSTYAELAALYLSRLKLSEKKYAEAREELESLGAVSLLGGSKAKPGLDEEILQRELASLLYGKSYFLEADDAADPTKKSELVAQGREHMKQLANSGVVVQAEATISYLRTAGDNAQKEESKSLAEEVLARTPELRQVLTGEFSRMGVALDQ